jgi:hypothetical protein
MGGMSRVGGVRGNTIFTPNWLRISAIGTDNEGSWDHFAQIVSTAVVVVEILFLDLIILIALLRLGFERYH